MCSVAIASATKSTFTMSILSCGRNGSTGKPGQEDKRPHHVELRCLGIAAVSQHNAGPENRQRHIRQQLAHHVLAKFLRARIRIVIGAVPIDRVVLGDDFVAALPATATVLTFEKAPQARGSAATAAPVERLPASRADSHSGNSFPTSDSARRRSE